MPRDGRRSASSARSRTIRGDRRWICPRLRRIVRPVPTQHRRRARDINLLMSLILAELFSDEVAETDEEPAKEAEPPKPA